MAAVRAQRQAHGLAVFGERRGVDEQVHLGGLFVAPPEADLVVDEIDARAALADFVGADHVLEMQADFDGGVGHGQANEGGVFFQAAPVALVGEGFAAHDAQSGEEPPAANEPRLSGGEPDFFEGEKLLVMKDVTMDHASLAKRHLVGAHCNRNPGREWTPLRRFRGIAAARAGNTAGEQLTEPPGGGTSPGSGVLPIVRPQRNRLAPQRRRPGWSGRDQWGGGNAGSCA